ncbi:MAG: PilZ domain-containing protein [Gammaproteobacteria bacterium]|nr:PilZ domain-containing protein [Gammaproteobacteria bacterium]
MLSSDMKSFPQTRAVFKRRSLRQTLSVPLRVFNRENGSRLGPIGNLSNDGLMLFSAKALLLGEVYPMAMVLPVEIRGLKSVAFNGRCVWCECSEDGASYVVGFSFDALDQSNDEILKILIGFYAS